MAGATTIRSALRPSRTCGTKSPLPAAGRRRQAVAEQRCPGRLGGKGAESERPDEPGRALGQDGADEGPGVAQAPAHLHRLVGGDATADTEDDPLARERCQGTKVATWPFAIVWQASPPSSSESRSDGRFFLDDRPLRPRGVRVDDAVVSDLPGGDLLQGDGQRLARRPRSPAAGRWTRGPRRAG